MIDFSLIPWWAWIVGYLLAAWGLNLLLKRFWHWEIYGPLAMWRTSRFNAMLDRFAHHTNFLDGFTKLALVFGFGALGFDYLVREKWSMQRRVIAFVIVTVLLSAFFLVSFDFLLQNPIAKTNNDWLALFYGVGGFAFFILATMGNYGWFIISSKLAGLSACPGVTPIVPGVEIPGVPITAPAHAWISFVIILAIHEGMHGVLLRKAKLGIKSTGLLLAGILPIGAFVEPDEKELKAAPKDDQWKVFVAGAGSNLALFAVLMLLVGMQPLSKDTPSVFSQLVYKPFVSDWREQTYNASISHYSVGETIEKTTLCGRDFANPAFGRIDANSTIVSINGEALSFAKPLPIRPNEETTVELIEPDGDRVTKTFVANELGRLGFTIETHYTNPDQPFDPAFQSYLQIESLIANFFFWLILLNLLVAAINFVPSEPFDGGKIAKVVFLPYFGWLKMPEADSAKLIGRLFMWITAIVFLVNLLPFVLG